MRILVTTLVFAFLSFNVGLGQIKDYDLRGNDVKLVSNIVEKYYNNDSVSKSYGFRVYFDTAGLIVRRESWSFSPRFPDTLTKTYVYNKGRLDKIIPSGCAECVDQYEYNVKGFLSKIVRFGKDGSVNSTFNVIMDTSGRVVEKDLSLWKEKYKYDSVGQLTALTKIFDDSTYQKNSFKYSPGNVIARETEEYHRGKFNRTTIKDYRYNSYGDRTESITRDEFNNEQTVEKYSYIYDDMGNWLYKFRVVNDKLYEITKRKIEYYK